MLGFLRCIMTLNPARSVRYAGLDSGGGDFTA
jgi:hypothetical protein